MKFQGFINFVIVLHSQLFAKVTNNDGKLLIVLGCFSVLSGLVILLLNRRALKLIYLFSNTLFSIVLVLIIGVVMIFENVKEKLPKDDIIEESKGISIDLHLELLYGVGIGMSVTTNLITLKYDIVGLMLYGLLLTQLLLFLCLFLINLSAVLIAVPIVFGIIISTTFYNFKFLSEVFVASFSGAFLYALSYVLVIDGVSQYVNYSWPIHSDGFYIMISFLIILSISFGFTHLFFIELSKPKRNRFFNSLYKVPEGVSTFSILPSSFDKKSDV